MTKATKMTETTKTENDRKHQNDQNDQNGQNNQNNQKQPKGHFDVWLVLPSSKLFTIFFQERQLPLLVLYYTLFQHYCRHCGDHFCANCCNQYVPRYLFGATGMIIIFKDIIGWFKDDR